jgi:hypothetical protein
LPVGHLPPLSAVSGRPLLHRWSCGYQPTLADTNRADLDATLEASPEVAAVTASVHAFAGIMNERRGRKLRESWMSAAEATGEPALRSFVTGLRADQEAVTNELSLRWNSDPRLGPAITAGPASIRGLSM